MTELRRLDKILKLFNGNKSKILSVSDIYQQIDVSYIGEDLPIMLMKLVEDKYLEFVTSEKLEDEEKENPNYILTFKGLLFIKKGGYNQEYYDKNESNDRIRRLETNAENNQRGMLILTIVLTVSSVISAFYYLTELCSYYGWTFCFCK